VHCQVKHVPTWAFFRKVGGNRVFKKLIVSEGTDIRVGNNGIRQGKPGDLFAVDIQSGHVIAVSPEKEVVAVFLRIEHTMRPAPSRDDLQCPMCFSPYPYDLVHQHWKDIVCENCGHIVAGIVEDK
jgi:hypothetical protein